MQTDPTTLFLAFLDWYASRYGRPEGMDDYDRAVIKAAEQLTRDDPDYYAKEGWDRLLKHSEQSAN